MPLPYENEVAADIRLEHGAVLQEMTTTLTSAVTFLSEASLKAGTRGVDRGTPGTVDEIVVNLAPDGE